MFARLRHFRKQGKKAKKPHERHVDFDPEAVGLGDRHLDHANALLSSLSVQDKEQMTREDIKAMLQAVGQNPSESELDVMLEMLLNPDDGDKTVVERLTEKFDPNTEQYGFYDFLHLWSGMIKSESEEEQMLHKAFQFFDRDGNGVISSDEFKGVMTELGECLTEEECDKFFGIMDANGDGSIQYQEFIKALQDARQFNLASGGNDREAARSPRTEVQGASASTSGASSEPSGLVEHSEKKVALASAAAAKPSSSSEPAAPDAVA